MVAHRLATLKSCDKIIELKGEDIINIGSYDDTQIWHENNI
jgi:ABC-type bacteriocin/lantibiotic exporter with double-glycine peptidase domain